MKIIDAYWEKRNLNLDTTEIVIETDDLIDDIRSALDGVQSEYVVVKVPVEQISLSFMLAELGYTFIETMMHIENNMLLKKLDPQKEEILAQIEIVPAEGDDVARIVSHLRKGLFHTDRISLDPYFTKELANKRYINWISDELDRGAMTYKCFYRGEEYGFAIVKRADEHVYRVVVSGIYPVFQGQGLAFTLAYKVVEILRKQGGQRLLTDVSSNNSASWKRYLHSGYDLTGFTYTFVKHDLNKATYLLRLEE